MRLYGVTQTDVTDCIDNPEWSQHEVTPSKVFVHAFADRAGIRWKRRVGHWLEVIYIDEGDNRVIITVGPRDDDPPEDAR
jgi:hypothetical protein